MCLHTIVRIWSDNHQKRNKKKPENVSIEVSKNFIYLFIQGINWWMQFNSCFCHSCHLENWFLILHLDINSLLIYWQEKARKNLCMRNAFTPWRSCEKIEFSRQENNQLSIDDMTISSKECFLVDIFFAWQLYLLNIAIGIIERHTHTTRLAWRQTLTYQLIRSLVSRHYWRFKQTWRDRDVNDYRYGNDCVLDLSLSLLWYSFFRLLRTTICSSIVLILNMHTCISIYIRTTYKLPILKNSYICPTVRI